MIIIIIIIIEVVMMMIMITIMYREKMSGAKFRLREINSAAKHGRFPPRVRRARNFFDNT